MTSVYIFLGLAGLFFIGIIGYVAISWKKWTSKQRKYAISGLVGLVAMISVSVLFSNSMSMAYVKPSELISQTENGKIKKGEEVKLEGEIVKGTIKGDKLGGKTEFDIKDKTGKISVVFTGIRPDNFKAGINAIAVGSYNGKVFNTSDVKTRCPSKYEAAAEKEKK